MSAYNIMDGPVQTQAGQRRFQQLDVELAHQIALGTNNDFLWGSGIHYLHMRADEELNHPGYYNDAIITYSPTINGEQHDGLASISA